MNLLSEGTYIYLHHGCVKYSDEIEGNVQNPRRSSAIGSRERQFKPGCHLIRDYCYSCYGAVLWMSLGMHSLY